jgi:hypothetical protein
VAADRLESADAAVPLADCLDSYFIQPSEIVRQLPPLTEADAVLDQAPSLALTVRGTPVVDLLRHAYHAMADRGGAA